MTQKSEEALPVLPEDGELTLDDALRLGIGLHQRGFRDEAIEVYQRVLAAQPEHAGALNFLGMAEHQAGRSARGLELLTRCTALYPDYADAHNNLGNMLLQLGKLESAALAYERSLVLRPLDPNALTNLATVRKLGGKLEEAQGLYKRVLELAPDHPEAHHNLGNVLTDLGRFGEALDVYQTALQLRPYDGDSHRRLGAVLYAVGRISEAAELYRRWCELEPDDPEAHHMLASCTGQNVPDRTSDRVVQKYFDRFAATFDAVLVDRLNYRAPQLVAEAVEKNLGPAPAEPALEVLDIGCGTGLCGASLRGYAARLTGVDLSQAMLNRAAERKLYDALRAEELTAHLRAQPAHYGLMVAADVLVYFGDLSEVSHAAAAALQPNGIFAFTVERSLPEDAPLGFRIHPHGRYSHCEPYLRTVLSAAGLRVVSIEHAHLRSEFAKPVDGWVVVARK